MCHQSVGLIQSTIEAAGIPTVSISLLREVTEKVKPPRVLFVDRPLGFPLGYPGKKKVQREILSEALALLSESSLPVWCDAKPIAQSGERPPAGQPIA